MANGNIIIRHELRPCKVAIETAPGCEWTVVNALFHRWYKQRAIVEFKNGRLTEVTPERLQFVDNIFSEYAGAWKDDDG